MSSASYWPRRCTCARPLPGLPRSVLLTGPSRGTRGDPRLCRVFRDRPVKWAGRVVRSSGPVEWASRVGQSSGPVEWASRLGDSVGPRGGAVDQASQSGRSIPAGPRRPRGLAIRPRSPCRVLTRSQRLRSVMGLERRATGASAPFQTDRPSASCGRSSSVPHGGPVGQALARAAASAPSHDGCPSASAPAPRPAPQRSLADSPPWPRCVEAAFPPHRHRPLRRRTARAPRSEPISS